MDDDVVGVGDEELYTRERMVQIVDLLSEMDEHILGLFDPALVARYAGSEMKQREGEKNKSAFLSGNHIPKTVF